MRLLELLLAWSLLAAASSGAVRWLWRGGFDVTSLQTIYYTEDRKKFERLLGSLPALAALLSVIPPALVAAVLYGDSVDYIAAATSVGVILAFWPAMFVLRVFGWPRSLIPPRFRGADWWHQRAARGSVQG